jgi:hypothetical protein
MRLIPIKARDRRITRNSRVTDQRLEQRPQLHISEIIAKFLIPELVLTQPAQQIFRIRPHGETPRKLT